MRWVVFSERKSRSRNRTEHPGRKFIEVTARLCRRTHGEFNGVLLVSLVAAFTQQRPPQLKTIPDSINFIWKDIEQDFTSLAEAMPEDKWSVAAGTVRHQRSESCQGL